MLTPFLWVLAVILTLAAGCSGEDTSPSGDPKSSSPRAEEVVVGIAQEPDSLDPLFGEMMAGTEIRGAIFRALVMRDDTLKLRPVMAHEIPTLENGGIELLPGGRMRTTWNIRRGYKWEDGAPVTAEDFVFAHRAIMTKGMPVITRDVDRRIEKMEAPDPYTLVVTWKEPFARANDNVHFPLPRHVLEPLLKRGPKAYSESFFNTKPVGNGPYRLTAWEPGNYLVLERNPHFPGTPVRLRRITYKIIPNTGALEVNLASGGVHAISPVGFSFDQALDLQKRRGNELRALFTPGMIWEHIDFNLDSPLLKDKRVRQALLYATNREGIVQALFEGRQVVAHSWLPPQHYGYNPDVKKYPYDPERAEELLEEAGWMAGKDGVRRKGDGLEMRLVLMTTAGDKVREKIQQVIRSNWRKVGVEVTIRNQPAKVYFGETVRYRKFPHLAMYAWLLNPASDGEAFWTKDNIPSEKNNWQGQNNTAFVHEEISRIDHLIPATIDEKERIRLFHREQEIWTEELPALPLYFRLDVSATRPEFRNWRPTGTDTPVTWNAETWHFVK
ncbi:MAG: peptide ABC transporter substrate-binding protein [Nitrospinota bacterium]